MFEFFKKDYELFAPVIGECVPLSEVPDKVFSEKMLGDGVAFVFTGDTIFSPCDGDVIMAADTNHAIGLKASNKAEILIHAGLETVNLNGQGLEILVKEGSKVKKGQALIKLDRDFLETKKINMITPMIITSQEYKLDIGECGSVSLESAIMKITR